MRVDWQTHRAFVYDSWEPEVTHAIDRSVAPGMTVADIGAQSGFYTLLLSKRVGLDGKVIAFEPLPANYRLLDENIRLNNIENVIIRHEAVGDHSGEVSFHFPTEEPSLIAGPVLAADSKGIFPVDCVSLDDFVSRRQIKLDLIKMDVEGAEGSVLDGALRTLTQFHPILIIELHDVGDYPRRHPVPIRLQALGYTIEWLDERPKTTHILAT
jgi:FkbM family methyltransferase